MKDILSEGMDVSQEIPALDNYILYQSKFWKILPAYIIHGHFDQTFIM